MIPYRSYCYYYLQILIMFLSRLLSLKQIVFALVIASMLISSLMAMRPGEGDMKASSTSSVARRPTVEPPLGPRMNKIFGQLLDAEEFAAQMAIDFKETTNFGWACRTCDLWKRFETAKEVLRSKFTGFVNTQFIPGQGFDYEREEADDLEIMLSFFDHHLTTLRGLYPAYDFVNTDAFLRELMTAFIYNRPAQYPPNES